MFRDEPFFFIDSYCMSYIHNSYDKYSESKLNEIMLIKSILS